VSKEEEEDSKSEVYFFSVDGHSQSHPRWEMGSLEATVPRSKNVNLSLSPHHEGVWGRSSIATLIFNLGTYIEVSG
jgi:hypothetical protein